MPTESSRSWLPGDYARPNEKYFAYADQVLRRAQELGFLVLLTPSYAGNNGGDEGWYQEMANVGSSTLRAYGRYLGNRYKGFTNIIWVHGGDFDPPNKDLVRAIAEGIQELDQNNLHTAHGSPGSSALDYWRGEPWLQVNNVYTYEPVFVAALQQHAAAERMPFFLMESAYENEHGVTEARLRGQAYQAVLAGAFGHVFGNNPIWHFDGPGLYQVNESWQQALDSRGANSMTHLCRLIGAERWWLLEPDVEHALLTGGIGNGDLRAMAARARDGSFALLYLPSARRITLDLRQLAGQSVDARWYDPSSGRFLSVPGAPLDAGRSVALRPPGRNDAGYSDWVLELTALPSEASRQ